MNEKSKSLARSKKSSIKLTDILLGASITALTGPGGGLAYGMSKVLIEHGHSFIRDRNDDRLKHFHETLVRGDLGENEVKEFLEKDIDLEEYYTLLRAAIQDDEDKKTYYYAEFLRKLALKQVPEEYKLYLMKIVRELTSFEIELIRQIFIYENYNLIPVQGSLEQLSNLLSEKNLNLAKKLAIDSFLRLGLLERDGQKLKPTDITLSTAKILFKKNDLTPSSIGRDVWRQEQALIITPQESQYSNLAVRIQQLLRNHRFRPAPILIFHPELQKIVSLIDVSIVILVIGRTGYSGFSSLEEMNNLVKIIDIPSSVKVIKLIANTADIPCDDFLPSIQADEVVDFLLDEPIDLQVLDKLIKGFASNE